MTPAANSSHFQPRIAALKSFSDVAGSIGHASLWDRIAAQLRLGDDPGAAFVLVQTLGQAGKMVQALRAPVHPTLIALAALMERLDRLSREADLQTRFGNRQSALGHCSGPLDEFRLLAAFTTPAHEESASRIAALHLLVLAGMSLELKLSPAAIVVADASRKAQSNPIWTALIRDLPDPAATPANWPDALIAWSSRRLQRQDSRPDPAVIVVFCRSVINLARLLGSRPEQQAEQLPLPLQSPDPEVGKVVHGPEIPRTGPRASRRDRHADDEHRAPAFARLDTSDAANPGGQEPFSIALHPLASLPVDDQPARHTVLAQDCRVVSYRLAEIDQVLRWSWDHLNPWETQLIASAARLQIQNRSAGWQDAVLTATVLATGQPVADAVQLPIACHDGDLGLDIQGCWTRPVLRPKQAWSPGKNAPAHLRAHAESITLELPGFLGRAYGELLREHPDAAHVGELLGVTADQALDRLSRWLDPIRAANPPARLTLGRLWRALAVELYADLGNDAAVHFVVATARDMAPTSTYYTALPAAVVAQAYRRASDRLFGVESASLLPLTKSTAPALTVGSRKAVDPDWLRGVIERLATEAQTRLGPAELPRMHNAFVTHALWLMMFATGHRPVADPIESLDIVDFDGGLLSLSDKLVRDPREARIVPLCHLAAAMLRKHIEHLRRLAGHLLPLDPALAARIRSVVADSGPRALPLFFYLEPDLEVVQISQAQLLRFVPEFASVQANFARHILSSGEAALGKDGDYLREMLGHVRHGQPAFGPQSPLGTADYESLRLQLDDVLGALGWEAVDSPLAPVRPAPVSRTTPQRTVLGQEARRRAALAAQASSRERAMSALKAKLGRRRLNQLQQADVDAVFRGILGDARTPGNAIEVEACRRAYRLLAWSRRRWGLSIKLPGLLVPLPALPQAFDCDTLRQAKVARRLPAVLMSLLQARARDRRHPEVSGGRQTAEAVASLVIDSRVADPDVAIELCDGGAFELLNDGDAGVYIVVSSTPLARETRMFRRYPLHALTAALLARLQTTVLAKTSIEARRPQMLSILKHLQVQLDPEGEIRDVASGLRWLCGLVSALNFAELSGTVAGYLDGSTRAVSLPPDSWARVVRGLPLQTGGSTTVKRIDDAPVAAEVPAPALSYPKSDPAPGVALARARTLHKAVNRLLGANVRSLAPVAERGSPSRNQKETLVPALQDLVDRSGDAPMFARALVQWLIQLMLQGVDGGELRVASCARYYYALAPVLPEVLADLDFNQLNDDALGQAYAGFIELLTETSQRYAFHRLLAFHDFMMAHHGLPPVNWSDIVSPTLLTSVSVDAGIITWAEYETALSLLASDPSADDRGRVLQAIVWMLTFRFGARISEVLGLRRKDVAWSEGRLILLFRPNAYRELKTDSAVRQVPLIGPMGPLEASLLERWLDHIDTCFAPDRMAALLACPDDTRQLVDTCAVTARISEAIFAATSDPALRIHHGRHSFGCRLQLIMNLDSVESAAPATELVRRILGPVEPKAARVLLLDSEVRSRRGLWATKLALGHASPATGQRCYFHLDDLIARVALAPRFEQRAASLSRRELAYVMGIGVEALPQAGDRARRIEMARVVRMKADLFESSSKRVAARAPAQLPPRPSATEMGLSAIQADQALGFAYRRGSLDGAHQTLLLPARQLQDLFTADFSVRETSGYDLPEARWPATRATLAVQHRRVGSRSPAESARVVPLLRQLQDLTAQPAFSKLTSDVVQIWQQYYRPDSTPIVVETVREAALLARWCMLAGIDSSALALRVPPEGNTDEAAEISATVERELNGLPVAVELGRLALTRSRFRRRDSRRIGFVVLENGHAALSQMSQFHRIMHVLASLMRMNLNRELVNNRD